MEPIAFPSSSVIYDARQLIVFFEVTHRGVGKSFADTLGDHRIKKENIKNIFIISQKL